MKARRLFVKEIWFMHVYCPAKSTQNKNLNKLRHSQCYQSKNPGVFVIRRLGYVVDASYLSIVVAHIFARNLQKSTEID